MMNEEELCVGKYYYLVSYLDENLSIPIIQTASFLGFGETGMLLFNVYNGDSDAEKIFLHKESLETIINTHETLIEKLLCAFSTKKA